MQKSEDFEFANDVRAAMEGRTPKAAWLLISAVLFIIVIGYVWADWAVVEEVTTGTGRVIPSSQVQVVQILERGVVRQILVREGNVVEKGQILLRMDDTTYASRLGELRQRRWTLLAEIARRRAEAEDREQIDFDPGLRKPAAKAISAQEQAFRAQRATFEGTLGIRRQQLVQKEQEYMEFRARETKLKDGLALFERELVLTEKMRENGSVPEIEFLRLKRQVIDKRGELAIVRAALPRALSAIAEAKSQIQNIRAERRFKARERLAETRGQLAIIDETLKAAAQKVEGVALKAPVKGIVNKLNVTTIGAVVQPGQDIIQIVPLDDNLFIETRIRPQDIAFIHPKQEASVKLSAYDYLIYGALSGKVERISADTIEDGGGESFYRVIVKTERNYIERNGQKLPIIPGMVASVDILTGKRTVLDYLLKPILKVRHEALREH